MEKTINSRLSARILLNITVFILIPVFTIAADFSIIANKSVPENILTKEEIKAIYLGKKTKWSDNSTIKFYLIRSPKSQKPFLEAYVGKTHEQFENYWMQNVFTGKGVMPDAVENSEEMIDAVGKTRGSIGFSFEETKGDNIKKIIVE